MALLNLACVLVLLVNISFIASADHHHVYHRIHVPTQVKTVFHTKIIKVPEHHHYVHEKETPKLVKIPEHHHYFHEKEKEKLVDLSHLHYQQQQQHDPHQDINDGLSASQHDFDLGQESAHNIYKKHAPAHLLKKTPRRRQKVSKS